MRAVQRLWMVALLAAAGCGKAGLSRLPQPPVSPPALGSPDGAIWYLRAESAALRGDLEEAERAWRWAVRLEPGDADLLARWGHFLSDQRRHDEALQAFGQALALDAHHPGANVGMGLHWLQRADREQALPYLIRAAGEGSVDGSALAVRTLEQLHRRDEAIAIFAAWDARPLREAGERQRRASLAADLGLADRAVDLFVAALERGDGGPEAALRLVDAARSSCRIGTAWRWAVREGLDERDEAWRLVSVEVALSARDAGLLERSLRDGDGLIGDLLLARVGLLVDAGQVGLAREVVERSLALSEEPRVRLEQARVLRALGQEGSAEAVLRGLLVDRAVGDRALTRLTDLLLARGAVDEALALFTDATGARRVPFTRALARLDLAAAEALWQSAEVSDAERWRRIAGLRIELGDVDGARAAFARAEGAIAALEWARLEAQFGTPEAAAEAWRQVVQVDPGSVEGWLALARLRPAEAPDHLRAALRADPCSAPVLLARAALEPGCAALPWIERGLEAAPTRPEVLDAALTAYDGCAAADYSRAHEGLLVVEQSWRALAETERADAVAARRSSLESE